MTGTRRQDAGRGIVTIEFAFGILAAIIVMIMLGWCIFLFGVKIAAVDAAGAVARQAARGDTEAVIVAEREGPAHARYSTRVSDGVINIDVVVDAHPIEAMPSFRLAAHAQAVLEPGQTGAGHR